MVYLKNEKISESIDEASVRGIKVQLGCTLRRKEYV